MLWFSDTNLETDERILLDPADNPGYLSDLRQKDPKEEKEKVMEKIKMIGANEMAVLIGISEQTLKSWYKFKKENPDNEYSMMLPDIQRGLRNKMLFKESDVEKLNYFKDSIPKGRCGIMGTVTQRYSSSRKKEHERYYIDKIEEMLKEKNVPEETIGEIRQLLEEEADERLGEQKRVYRYGKYTRKQELMFDVTGEHSQIPDDFDERFNGYIKLIKPNYRKILEEYYIEGKSLQEIADEMGMTRQRIHAMKKLFIDKARKAERK